MMTRESGKKREQIQLMSLDDLVPQDHLARELEAALDWNFIYELVEEKYSEDSGRPSIDPVVLIKLLSTYGRPKTKKDSSQSMSMSMMSTTTAIPVPTTSFCITPPRTGNTGAAARSLQAVPILHSVPTARSTSRP